MLIFEALTTVGLIIPIQSTNVYISFNTGSSLYVLIVERQSETLFTWVNLALTHGGVYIERTRMGICKFPFPASKWPSIAAKYQLKTCHSCQLKTRGPCLSISLYEAAYQWAIIVWATASDTCSAESHTGKRGGHLNTNQTGPLSTRRGRDDREEEREGETAGFG